MANKKGFLEKTAGKVFEGAFKGIDNLINELVSPLENKKKAPAKKVATPKAKKETPIKTVAKKKK